VPKIWGFPLTLIVTLTTVLCTTALHCACLGNARLSRYMCEICVHLCFTDCRILSWFVVWILQKKAKLNIQIGRVGYFCVHDITIVISSTLTVVCRLALFFTVHLVLLPFNLVLFFIYADEKAFVVQ